MSNEYRYSACGLDVRIWNLPIQEDDLGVQFCVIPHLPALHREIARAIIYSTGQRVNGPELKFLRTELGLTPGKMAAAVNQAEADIRRWEGAGDTIPAEVDLEVRLKVIADLRIFPQDGGLRQGRVGGRVELSFDDERLSYGVAA